MVNRKILKEEDMDKPALNASVGRHAESSVYYSRLKTTRLFCLTIYAK